jgi:hypothetical protein
MPSQAASEQDDEATSVYEDERPRYRHFFRCSGCGNRFHVDRLTADSNKVKTPKCPRKACVAKVRQSHMPDIGMDVSAGRAPAATSIQAIAYDTALRWATEEQGVTNILDRPRQGESSAPPLEPRLQKLSEGFWGGPRKQNTRTARVDMSGIFGERAIAAQQGQPATGAKFTADQGVAVAPILTAKPQGSSPVPDHTVIGAFNPNRR